MPVSSVRRALLAQTAGPVAMVARVGPAVPVVKAGRSSVTAAQVATVGPVVSLAAVVTEVTVRPELWLVVAAGSAVALATVVMVGLAAQVGREATPVRAVYSEVQAATATVVRAVSVEMPEPVATAARVPMAQPDSLTAVPVATAVTLV